MDFLNFSTIKKNLLHYAGAFFFPFIVLIIFKATAIWEVYPEYKNVFSFYAVFLCSVSGLTFFLYLSCSPCIPKLSPLYQYLFSFSYALSSYALANSQNGSSFFLYILLPVLFLFFEKYIYVETSMLPLVFVFAVSLCFDAATSCILFLYFIFFLILFSQKNFAGRVADLIQLILMFLFSLLISAAFSFSSLKTFFFYVKDIPYPDFSVNYPLSQFLLRFMPGTFFSDLYIGNRGLDLYLSLFFFFLFICSFFMQKQSVRELAKKLFFFAFLIATLEFTPFMHLIELCSDTNAADVYYSFFFLFCILRQCAVSFTDSFENIGKKRYFGVLLAILSVTVGLSHSCTYLPTITLITVIVYTFLYAAYILLLPVFLHKKSCSVILPLIVISELICNTVICTSRSFIPNTMIQADHFFAGQTSTDEQQTIPYQSEYVRYYQSHYANQLYDVIRTVNEHVELTDEEIRMDYPYGIVSEFEEFDLKMQKIGITQKLFVPLPDTISFEESDLYNICYAGSGIYNLAFLSPASDMSKIIVPFSYDFSESDSVKDSTHIIFCNSITGDLFEMPSSENMGYLQMFNTGVLNINFMLQAYQVNDSVIDLIAPALEQYYQRNADTSFNYLAALLPLVCSFSGLLLFLFMAFHQDKEALAVFIQKKKKTLASKRFFVTIRVHFCQNRIYYLSFLIPFGCFLTAMIVYSCEPFGSKSFLDQDGYASVLGGILQSVYPFKEGNFLLTYNGGFYSSVFPGLYSLYTMLLALFDIHAIAGILVFTEGILIGGCGFSVCYYLTHRFIDDRADKSDIRLLIPALIYSLNTYMIAMHSYVYQWYLLFFLLPLLVLSLERMLYEKKWMRYLILLSVCVGTNLNISLYMCIYLALHFFLCRFDGIRDFIKKGILFGVVSVTGVMCSFINVFGFSSGRSSTGYAAADSIKPTPGFYTSFFEQWKKWMFMTEYITTSENDGELNLYMGCLTLILCLVFLFFCQKKRSDKIRRFFVMLFLLLSFNGMVLSYLWNGLHYPSGVPNRFVFLFMFLCAVSAYDAMKEMHTLSIKKAGICFFSVFLFIIAVQVFSSGNTKFAFYGTLLVLTVYFAIHILLTHSQTLSHYYYPVIILCFALEMAANLFYNCGQFLLDNNSIYGDFEAIAKTNQKVLDTDPSFSRFAFPATYGENFGFFRNTPTISIFTSTLGQSLQFINNYYGFNSGANYIVSNSDATPFGLSLSNTEFLQIPAISSFTLRDLDRYDYIGYSDGHFILRNPDVLSLGIYVPDTEAIHSSEWMIHPLDFANELSALYQRDPKKNLMIPLMPELSDRKGQNDTYCFLDKDFNPISRMEATEILTSDETLTNPIFANKNVYLSVNITPVTSGYVYLYANEFVALGYFEKGKTKTVTIEYPNKTFTEATDLSFCILDEDIYREFIDTASMHQLNQVMVEKNRITAIYDYDQDGYTLLSMPYSSAWDIYIDGEPAEGTELYHYFMGVKSPKGTHTLEMVYSFDGSLRYYAKILCLIFAVILIYAAEKLIRRKKS